MLREQRHVLCVRQERIHPARPHVNYVPSVSILKMVPVTVRNVRMAQRRLLQVRQNVINVQLERTLLGHSVPCVLLVRVLLKERLYVLNVNLGTSQEKEANLANHVVQHDGCSLLVRPVTPLNEISQGHASGGSMEIAS